ncbi:MAG TPA: hypothetical protein VFQ25_13405 [Ktedonobacterales bacterium]|nr:hypothetical protein [Ktedonobacterales bacterium]
MSQDAPQAPTPPALFDPASVVSRDYETAAVVVLALWCMIGILTMFAGNALLDTFGLGLTGAEVALLLIIDRRGFYTVAGLFNVDQWNRAQRLALAVAEVPLFFVALIVYVIRIGMAKFTELQASPPDSGSDRS